MSQLSKHLLPVNKELKRKLWPENFQEELKMNEHFKKLAEQCTETWTSYFDGQGNVTTTTFDKEKFAELIVKRCIQLIDEENARLCEYQNSLPEWDGNRRDDCDLVIEKCIDLAETIKKHFGVSE